MTFSLPNMDRLPAQERGLTIADFLVPIRISERLYVRARHIALIVAGAVLISLCAQIYVLIPGNPVPFTGQTFGVMLSAGALGFRRGIAASVLYLAIGALGLPVFAQGKHGLDILLGATGGYLVGFVLASAIVGRLAELGWDRRLLGALGAMALGNVAIYLVGVPWLMAVTGYTLPVAIEKGVLPFLVGDAIKLLLAAAALPAAWWLVGRRAGEG